MLPPVRINTLSVIVAFKLVFLQDYLHRKYKRTRPAWNATKTNLHSSINKSIDCPCLKMVAGRYTERYTERYTDDERYIQRYTDDERYTQR
jgi:hypothetical protein